MLRCFALFCRNPIFSRQASVVSAAMARERPLQLEYTLAGGKVELPLQSSK